MKRILLASAMVFGAMTTFALAETVTLMDAQMDEVRAGAILQVNGGGNIPNGNANGVPASNPAGFQPPGQNK
jgi:hypothetical protein